MKVNSAKAEAIMAERGLTKKALSDACGISAQNISTVLRRGTCEPRTLGKLAAGLGVSVTDIMKEEPL